MIGTSGNTSCRFATPSGAATRQTSFTERAFSSIIRDTAATLGLIVNIEDSWGGDLTTAAVSHLAASTAAETAWMVSFMNDWTNEHIAGYQPRSRSGIGAAPSGPGLGVEVDLEILGEPLFGFGA